MAVSMWKDVLVVGRCRCRLVLEGKFYFDPICASIFMECFSLHLCLCWMEVMLMWMYGSLRRLLCVIVDLIRIRVMVWNESMNQK